MVSLVSEVAASSSILIILLEIFIKITVLQSHVQFSSPEEIIDHLFIQIIKAGYILKQIKISATVKCVRLPRILRCNNSKQRNKGLPPGQSVGPPGSGQTANQKPPSLGPGGSNMQMSLMQKSPQELFHFSNSSFLSNPFVFVGCEESLLWPHLLVESVTAAVCNKYTYLSTYD